MNQTNPFQAASNVTSALSLDDILRQSKSANSQEQQQDIMGQILQRLPPERRGEAMQFLQNRQQQMVQQRQAQAYREQGLNPNLPEGINKEIIKKRVEGGDKQKAYQNSLNLLGRAKEIAGSGHLGPKIGILGTGRDWGSTISSEGQRLRSEYKQIGKALVQAAAPLKITNRTEFQHYAEDLEDPTRTLEEIEGTLATLERIVRNSIGEEQQFVDQKAQSTMQTPQQAAKPPAEKPSLNSFYR